MKSKTLFIATAIAFLPLLSHAQISSVMQGCQPGTMTCNRLVGGFGDEMDMNEASSSKPCTKGTSDPAGSCGTSECFFQETTGVVWWCTSAGWAPGGNASSGGRFISVYKDNGAQSMTDGHVIDGWTLQERSSIDDFTINVATTQVIIEKEGVYLINGGVNAEVDSDTDDCMTFSTTVDGADSSSAAAKAAGSDNEYFFQSVFSMVTDVSTVPASVSISASDCGSSTTASVKSGSTWMNISIVSAVASGSALDTGPVPDCPNNTDSYQDGAGGCDTPGGDVSGPLDNLVVQNNSHDHVELNVTDLSHTVDTNAGTLCTPGQFLNGDGTCDPVVVDTNAGTICAPGEYLDGDATCKTVASGLTVGGDANDIQVNDGASGLTGGDQFEADLTASHARLSRANATPSTSAPGFYARQAGGSLGTPSVMGAGDIQGDFRTDSWDGSAWQTGVLLRGINAETWSGSALGSTFELWTRANTTTTIQKRMIVAGDGTSQWTSDGSNGVEMTAAGLFRNLGMGIVEADQLATNPAACTPGDFVKDVDQDGTLVCDTPAGGSLPVEVVECNGTDDDSTIQTAIDALTTNGGIVEIVSQGTACDIDDDIEPKSNVAIRCWDRAELLAASSGLTSGVFATSSNIDSFEISGCFINMGTSTDMGAIHVGDDSENFLIENNWIEAGSIGSLNPLSLVKAGCANASASNRPCALINNTISGKENTNVTGVEWRGGSGTFGSNVVISMNRIQWVGTGVDFAVTTSANFVNNTIYECLDACVAGILNYSAVSLNNISVGLVAGSAYGMEMTQINNSYVSGNIFPVNVSYGAPAFYAASAGGLFYFGNYTANGIELDTSGTGFMAHVTIANNVFANSDDSVIVDNPLTLVIVGNSLVGEKNANGESGIEINCHKTDSSCENVSITSNNIAIAESGSVTTNCIELNDGGGNGIDGVTISDNFCGTESAAANFPTYAINWASGGGFRDVIVNGNNFVHTTNRENNAPSGMRCANLPTAMNTCDPPQSMTFLTGANGDAAGQFFWVGSNSTASSVDWVPTVPLTTSRLTCTQVGDSSCVLGFRVAKNGADQGTTCTSTDESTCSTTPSVAFDGSSDGMTVEVMSNSGCGTGVAIVQCEVEFSYD